MAFKKINLELGENYRLVIVGGNIYKEEENILITGCVDENRLNNLYRGADLCVLPSLYEGFGFPALEAMKRGVAVVSSGSSCLKEILGEAALYFNPLDVDDMAEKIKKALLDKGLRENLINKGLERVKIYNWIKTAEETLDIYRTI